MGQLFYPCDAAFNLFLPLANISSPTELVAGVDRADDGHIRENYNEQRHEEIEEENADDVELERNGVQRSCPVDFTRPIPASCRRNEIQRNLNFTFFKMVNILVTVLPL